MLSTKIQEIQAGAKQRAIELAIKELQTQDSLNNVNELRDTIEKQNEIVRNKLRTVVNTQVEESEVAMKTLGNSYDTHASIQNYFKSINTKAKQAQDLYDNYALIRKCVITSRNIRRAMEGLDRILKLAAEIKFIEDLIENDYTQVFEAYERIVKLEEVRDAALLESVGEHSFFLEVFKEYFKNINQTSEKFNELIFKSILTNDGITTIGQEEPQLLVQIARVIEEEEKRDAHRSEEMEKLEKRHATVDKKDKKGDDQTRVVLKKFKQRLYDVVDVDIRSKIYAVIEPKAIVKGEKVQAPPIPKALNTLIDTMTLYLDTAQIDIEPCFPDSYNMLEYCISTFNKYFTEYTEKLMKDRVNLDYSDTLALAYWMRIDYPIAIEEFLVGDARMINFKDKAQTLLDEFIIFKNESQLSGVRIAVDQDFSDDMRPLPKPSTNYPYTPSCVELFTMLNTQLDQVKESKNSNRADFVLNMVKTNTSVLISYSQWMQEGIRKRVKTINPLFVMAYANNVTLCRKLLDQFMKRLLEMLHADFHEQVSMKLNPAYESFTEMLNVCIDSVIEILMEDIEEDYQKMFDKEWENNTTNPFFAIMDCVVGFKKQNVVEKEYSDLLFERLLGKIQQKYLDVMILGKKNLKDVYGDDDTLESKIEDDMTEMEQVFCEFLQKDQIQEVTFPLMNVKFFLKELTRCKDDLDKFIFALNELLREYPQCWDVANSLVNHCSFISSSMKSKMKDCIEASFLKEYQGGAEPSTKKSPLSKYTKDFSIFSRREAEKKNKAPAPVNVTTTIQPKKVDTPKEVKKEVPKEVKKDADSVSLDDFLGGESLDF